MRALYLSSHLFIFILALLVSSFQSMRLPHANCTAALPVHVAFIILLSRLLAGMWRRLSGCGSDCALRARRRRSRRTRSSSSPSASAAGRTQSPSRCAPRASCLTLNCERLIERVRGAGLVVCFASPLCSGVLFAVVTARQQCYLIRNIEHIKL